MGCQPLVQFPVAASIRTDPQAGRIDSSVKDIGFAGAARLNHPDCMQFLSALLRELQSMLRLKPCLAKVVAVAQKRAKKRFIIGGKEAVMIAWIEDGVIDTVPSQQRSS